MNVFSIIGFQVCDIPMRDIFRILVWYWVFDELNRCVCGAGLPCFWQLVILLALTVKTFIR